MTFNELMQGYVDMSYEEIVERAKTDLGVLMPYFAQYDKEHNGAGLVFPFMCTCLAVDGQFTEKEAKFYSDIMEREIPYEQAKEVIQMHYSDNMTDLADKFFDASDKEVKAMLLDLACCILAVDERMGTEEVAFIKKLLD